MKRFEALSQVSNSAAMGLACMANVSRSRSRSVRSPHKVDAWTDEGETDLYEGSQRARGVSECSRQER